MEYAQKPWLKFITTVYCIISFKQSEIFAATFQCSWTQKYNVQTRERYSPDSSVHNTNRTCWRVNRDQVPLISSSAVWSWTNYWPSSTRLTWIKMHPCLRYSFGVKVSPGWFLCNLGVSRVSPLCSASLSDSQSLLWCSNRSRQDHLDWIRAAYGAWFSPHGGLTPWKGRRGRFLYLQVVYMCNL